MENQKIQQQRTFEKSYATFFDELQSCFSTTAGKHLIDFILQKNKYFRYELEYE